MSPATGWIPVDEGGLRQDAGRFIGYEWSFSERIGAEVPYAEEGKVSLYRRSKRLIFEGSEAP